MNIVRWKGENINVTVQYLQLTNRQSLIGIIVRKMELNQLRMLVFSLVFLRIQCLAVENVTTQHDEQNQQKSLSTENPNKTQSHEIHFDSGQTKRINQFSTEILFVSEKTIILSLSLSLKISAPL